jgi:hypothetical protein
VDSAKDRGDGDTRSPASAKESGSSLEHKNRSPKADQREATIQEADIIDENDLESQNDVSDDEEKRPNNTKNARSHRFKFSKNTEKSMRDKSYG